MPSSAPQPILQTAPRRPSDEAGPAARGRWGRGWIWLVLALTFAPAATLAQGPQVEDEDAPMAAAEVDTADLEAEAEDDDGPTTEVTVAAGALADEPEAPTDLHDSDACPRLFGTEHLTEKHAARRERVLWGVERAASVVEVEHSAGWDRPHYLEFRGLELVDAAPGAEATFRVTPTLDRPGCEAGEYTVGVDDSLGERGHVLAVLNDVVLVEYLGQLSYLATPEATIPTWRMVWRSPWKLVKRRHTGVASSTMPTRRANRYRRPTRRSSKRRR